MKLFIFFIFSIFSIIYHYKSLKIKDKLQLTGSGSEPDPMLLNITYVTPMRDLDEERKYTGEHLHYMTKVKRLESKIMEDIDMMKEIMNTQNEQIDRLNEVLMVNYFTAKELEACHKKE